MDFSYQINPFLYNRTIDNKELLFKSGIHSLFEEVVKGIYDFPNTLSHFLEKSIYATTENHIKVVANQVFVKNPAVEAENFIEKIYRKEAVTALEAKDFLEYVIDSLLYKEDSSMEQDWLYDAQKYYEDTRQIGRFNILLNQVQIAAIKNANHPLPKTEKFLEMEARVLATIISKGENQPAVAGHSRELFTKEEYDLIVDLHYDLIVDLHSKNPNSHLIKKAYATILFAIDQTKERVSEILGDLNEKETYVDKVVQAKEVIRKIVVEECTRIDFSLLEDRLSKKDQTMLRSLFHLSSHKGESIDIALIDSWIEEHKAGKLWHPRVVIEGGGPSGLFLAITQFRAGAQVALLEKRSMQYSRPQIVKLDPKWIAELKFYLGDDFYTLFEGESKKSSLKSDGTADITIRDLEDVLHLRLTKLISRLEVENGDISPIQRLSAHECDAIAFKDDQFLCSAKYIPNQDLGITKPKEEGQKFPVDILFCAGGKHSSFKESFFPSSVPVTSSGYYGVCSWNLPAENGENTDIFPDFMGMFQVDDKVLKGFNEDVKNYINDRIEFVERKNIQIRTFQAGKVVYIGMEFPEEVYKILEQLPTSERKHVENLWFQRVLLSRGDKAKDINIDCMDKTFCATFPLDQQRLSKNSMVSVIEKEDKSLVVLAAGDALASPHFMFYSGLTGARESIMMYEKMTQAMANSATSTVPLYLEEQLNSISNFVVNRGSPFLKRKSDKEIEESRLEKITKLLESGLERGLLHKEGSLYEFTGAGLKLQAMPGWIEDVESKKRYNSLAQIELENSLFYSNRLS